jgi:hypothetical protein
VKLRCVMAWQNYRVGDVIDPPANRRGHLLAMRWAGRPFWEPVPDAAPADSAEPAPMPPPGASPEAPHTTNRKQRRRAS